MPEGHAPTKEGLRPSHSTWFGAGAAACAALGASGILGSNGELTFMVVGVGALALWPVAMRRNRPLPRLAWAICGVAIALLTAGGALRDGMHTLGNLTPARPLLPDLVTLPGYGLLALGLTMMTAGATAERRIDVDAILDAATVALGILAVAWVYLIAPALLSTTAPVYVRIILATYPTLSVFLVAIAARMVFIPFEAPTRATKLMFASVCCLLVGDVLYALTDTRLATLSTGLLDFPYGLAYAAAGASLLHPSAGLPRARIQPADSRPSGRRMVLVTLAVGMPAVLMALRPQPSTANRVVLSVIALGLTACAMSRVGRSMRAHAHAQDRLVQQATHDPLTGLPNRRLARDFMDDCLSRREEAAVGVGILFLDLDRFKLVNDSMGHSRGDQLLCSVASRIRSRVQASDLVARIGGDEFVIILDGLSSVAEAVTIGERIRADVFREPFSVAGVDLYSTASIGIAYAEPQDRASTAETLTRDADTAMYQAKLDGGNACALFSVGLRARVSDRLRLERDLRRAMEREELSVVYQPIVSLSAGNITGFEALLRWSHPTDGDVPPGRFVPVAEESGLIVDIGEWVIHQAAAAVASWRRADPDWAALSVAVNVSARQLKSPTLLLALRSALDIHRLSSSALKVELTESVLIDNDPETDRVLSEIRELGVGISLDDFGTGYSSLSYLQRYPVDFVKIDQSFVAGLRSDDTSEESLVEAIVAMSHALGMRTIAEGIEVGEQRERLMELGCDAGQGWLWSPAVAASAVPDLLRRTAVKIGAWLPVDLKSA